MLCIIIFTRESVKDGKLLLFSHTPNFFATFFQIFFKNIRAETLIPAINTLIIKQFGRKEPLILSCQFFVYSLLPRFTQTDFYSTVTDLARFRGISTFFPLLMAI